MVTPQNTARFWSHVDRGPGCWEWQAARTRRGYGQGWIGKRGLAHRLAWEVTYGPIPPGLSVLFRQQPTRRLSPALVREIRTRHAAGERARDLARAYGVHESSLSLLVRRLSYRAA